ncbi:hypothetical protein AAK899_05715 [Erysipelotrichaceae bacterium 51-3]
MNRTIKLWWLASGIMAVLFGFTCLLDYLHHFSSHAVTTSAPYWAFVVVRAIEFLIPAALFALIALYLMYRHHHKKEGKKIHASH